MMEYTDRYFRYMFRLMSKDAILYTEMVTANALVDEKGNPRGDPGRFLRDDDSNKRTVLQLGGALPAQLAHAAELARPYGYCGINLNCGCPSERVAGAGRFGASLMYDPALIAECCDALSAGGVPVTVKCRVGVVSSPDDLSTPLDYDHLTKVISAAANVGVTRFQIHARVAVLSGLSPDANRKVPPIREDVVDRLVDDFPHLQFVFNGQVDSVQMSRERIGKYHGVMVGREAYKKPWHWSSLDTEIFGRDENPTASRRLLLEQYSDYGMRVEEEAKETSGAKRKSPRRALVKPLLNLFYREKGASAFKRRIDSLLASSQKKELLDFRSFLTLAVAEVTDPILDAPPPLLSSKHREEKDEILATSVNLSL